MDSAGFWYQRRQNPGFQANTDLVIDLATFEDIPTVDVIGVDSFFV